MDSVFVNSSTEHFSKSLRDCLEIVDEMKKDYINKRTSHTLRLNLWGVRHAIDDLILELERLHRDIR